MRVYLKVVLFALGIAMAPALSHADDAFLGKGKGPPVVPQYSSVPAELNNRVPLDPPPGAVEVDPNTIVVTTPSPTQPAPMVKYGCKRIWRCDAIVCDWRRGCWGPYGYMEGPYYTLELAKRAWERDGWPATSNATPRRRIDLNPSK